MVRCAAVLIMLLLQQQFLSTSQVIGRMAGWRYGHEGRREPLSTELLILLTPTRPIHKRAHYASLSAVY